MTADYKRFGKSAGLERKKNLRDQDTKMTDEEIQEAADKIAKKFESITGKKANKYKHINETKAQKFNREQDELKAKKKKEAEKLAEENKPGLFSTLKDMMRSTDKPKKKKDKE